MMKFFHIFLVVILLKSISGCTQQKKSAKHECLYNQELTTVNDSAKLGSIFLFGERHGTAEAPSFVANFACKIAEDTKQPTIVLLELSIPKLLSKSSTDNISVAEAQTLILDGDHHWSSGQDGRTSVAMMEAITQILKLKEQGLDIALGSIYPEQDIISKHYNGDIPFGDESLLTNRYFKEALQILKYKEKFKNVITLSGSVHTSNHLKLFEEMSVDTSYLGFRQVYGGGTEWNCQKDSGGCKAHLTIPRRKNLVDSSDDGSLVLLDGQYELYDGVFVFKTTTASYPFLEDQIKN